jgi:hypothetical protein
MHVPDICAKFGNLLWPKKFNVMGQILRQGWKQSVQMVVKVAKIKTKSKKDPFKPNQQVVRELQIHEKRLTKVVKSDEKANVCAHESKSISSLKFLKKSNLRRTELAKHVAKGKACDLAL